MYSIILMVFFFEEKLTRSIYGNRNHRMRRRHRGRRVHHTKSDWLTIRGVPNEYQLQPQHHPFYGCQLYQPDQNYDAGAN